MIINGHSDIGKKRPSNQDKFFIYQDDTKSIGLIADGMGGHKAGEVASDMAIRIIKEELLNGQDPNKKDLIKNAIGKANTKIYLQAQKDECYKGMGTTVNLVFIEGNNLLIANVGDSRSYIFRDNKLTQLTQDHSFVQELINEGSLNENEAFKHPRKNIITRAVGTKSILQVDLYEFVLLEGDIVLQCSDGLTDMVEDEEIEFFLRRDLKVNSASKDLVDLANSKGGNDNVTVVTIFYKNREVER